MRALCFLVLIASTAIAEPKPEVAIVGIEGKDVDSAKAADTLTATLRTYAGAKSGLYQPKGTPKQLAAAVLKADCKASVPACAVTIGTAMATDYVLAGQIETRGKHYVLTLSLVNVRTKQRVRSLRDSVATSNDLRKWARTSYERLVDPTTGELTVVSNAKQGEVLLDGEPVGALWEGRATISGIALGNHELAIRSRGYRAFSVEIRIDGSNTQNVLLEPAT